MYLGEMELEKSQICGVRKWNEAELLCWMKWVVHDLEAINNISRAVWYSCLNNSFQCLNNNNTFDMYFYNTQTRIFTTLKIEQQYLNIATKRAKRSKHYTCSVLL